MAEALNVHAEVAAQRSADVQRRSTLEPPVIVLTDEEADEFDRLVLEDLQHQAGEASARRRALVREVLGAGLLAAMRARGMR